jgi:hypothetical protein
MARPSSRSWRRAYPPRQRSTTIRWPSVGESSRGGDPEAAVGSRQAYRNRYRAPALPSRPSGSQRDGDRFIARCVLSPVRERGWRLTIGRARSVTSPRRSEQSTTRPASAGVVGVGPPCYCEAGEARRTAIGGARARGGAARRARRHEHPPRRCRSGRCHSLPEVRPWRTTATWTPGRSTPA